MKRGVLVVSIILWGSGCHFNTKLQDVQRFSASPPQRVNVRLGPKLAALVDRSQEFTDIVTFPTGQVARGVFVGKPDCPWTIELISSAFLAHQDSMVPTTATTYQLSCLLSGPHSQAALSASGVGHAWISYAKASTQAVEEALNSLAVQAQACMAPDGPAPIGTSRP